ncbi:DNA polymerase III subunit tau [Corynebacterium ciconiae DSM 44920]|uniref:DNA polymerase III subunit gamma and tau n=1 Tax=Corynebacterium ciconiae TaxID=227319 RepID=UPI00036F4436|nr:DNA polymerase III subunit gamma and tau [Corynebacterium ciconiae]WKD60200.1 DNA polymerase III subunit tau [Corynebacterium ciconiae DSM 44920]
MALYRKYRPASFAEVVGQEHVTQPLSVALDSGRINHAYLFSGPRGCGKTSSARIMARSLNCVNGPTSTPCGVCPSCVSLAPGGPGNLDVTELDAASHRGVDDMRELRDRAYYAPAESRYRVFIIDEAHMITTEGSNALLKIVEEPPEHLIFIFATTEPEKVINTIRSRTHHYPFRLLTPMAMRGLLERTVEAEQAQVDDAVYPLVIRSGGGSPRDSLSILDQLLAGAGPDGLSYEQAVALLGVTNDSLLDAAVEALASEDYAAMFATVDDVIEGGFEPRQFALDLLNRLRDLMVVRTVHDAMNHGLVDVPSGREAVLSEQAARFSPDQLARMAALTNDGLSDMRGATSARLLLEVMCAKLMLPTAAAGSISGAESVAAAAPASPAAPARGGSSDSEEKKPARRFERKSVREQREREQREREERERQQRQQERERQQRQQERERQAESPRTESPQEVAQSEAPQAQPAAESAAEPEREEAGEEASTSVVEHQQSIVEQWPEIRRAIFEANARTGVMIAEARVLEETPEALTLGHHTGALATRLSAPEHAEVIAQAITQVTGAQVTVSCVIGTRVPARTAASENTADADTEEEEPARPEPRAPGGWVAPQLPPEPGTTAPVREPEPEKKPEPPRRRWQERAARGNPYARPGQQPPPPEPEEPSDYSGRDPYAGMADSVPLPPEPEPDDAAPEHEAPPSMPTPTPGPPVEESEEDVEESFAREAAEGEGSADRRDQRTVAIELLQEQLGAKLV